MNSSVDKWKADATVAIVWRDVVSQAAYAMQAEALANRRQRHQRLTRSSLARHKRPPWGGDSQVPDVRAPMKLISRTKRS